MAPPRSRLYHRYRMSRLGRHRRVIPGLLSLCFLLAGCEIVVTTGPVGLYATYDTFTVDRYGTASVTLFGLTTDQNIGPFSIDASCTDGAYPGATTYLSGSTEPYAGEVRHVTLWYVWGDPYFDFEPVWCSFYGETTSGREVIIRRY